MAEPTELWPNLPRFKQSKSSAYCMISDGWITSLAEILRVREAESATRKTALRIHTSSDDRKDQPVGNYRAQAATMPPKFARIPGSSDRAYSDDIERRGLLDGDSDDEDFFLRGPKVGNNGKLTQVRGQVDEVMGIMKDNVNRVADRGDRLEDLQDKSDSLVNNADMFRSRSKSLHRNMWWQNCRLRILITIVVLVLVLIVIIPIIVHYSSDKDDKGGN